MNSTLVYANVLPRLSQMNRQLTESPTLPADLRYVTDKSVETPVLYSPLLATANDPPVSTKQASTPPCKMFNLFYSHEQWYVRAEASFVYTVMAFNLEICRDEPGTRGVY